MPTINESLNNESILKGPLDAGIDTISQSQTVQFTLYVKLILPLDGYVFWVRSDLVSQLSVCNCYLYQPAPVDGTSPPGAVLDVQGSLHNAIDSMQNEDETVAVNSVVFTAESEVQDFNKVGPCVMYIGVFEGKKFAFNKRGSFYEQSGIYHYKGNALYPALASQIVDDLTDFDTNNVVVSNSLPIWLMMNQFFPVYPSFLVEENLEPPYASIHIPSETTQAIGFAPRIGRRGHHSQLVQERVKITLYGLRNYAALDFQDYVLQYSMDHEDLFGIMNSPVMRDEKRTQPEFTVLAQKKTFELEVNYYQNRIRDVARQLILKCIPTFEIGKYLD